LPHIFERFYRAASSSTSESRSGGLGLSIAQAIVRAQGGVIECESSPAAGSLFTVTLPAKSTDGDVVDSAPKQKLILS